MTTIENWNAHKLDRYADALARGFHDDDCEQRERFGLCGCRERKRLADGPTELPVIWHQSPQCSNCLDPVDYDGDNFTCSKCHVKWPAGAMDGDEGEWDDVNGDLSASTAEKWGERLIELVNR